MGRAVRASDDSLIQRAPRKSRIDERSTRKYKKRKRRGELNDIHRKIVKADGALSLQEADKKEKKGAKEKAAKAQVPAKISSRILPRPSGIYRNGARGKEIRKAQKNLTAKDLDDARLLSDVFKLVNAEESAAHYVQKNEEASIAIPDDSDNENTLQDPPMPRKVEMSPILGKNDRKKREDKDFLTARNSLVQDENSSDEELELAPVNKYEQLCSTIVARNYIEENGLEDVVPDPLGVAKSKLRNIYASTFASTYLQQKIRAGIDLDDPTIPTLQTSSTDDCYYTWKNWRTPESSKILPKCSQVDTATPLSAADLRNQYDNRRSDSALEPSGNFEADIIEDETPAKFFEIFNKNNQRVDVPVRKKEINPASSSRQESTVTETIREVKARKRVNYQEVEDESQNIRQVVTNRKVSKGQTKSFVVRKNESEKLKQLSQKDTRTRNPSVQHVPTILRRKKTVQTLKSNHSNVKSRSRRVREGGIFEEALEARQESFIPERTFHAQRVETPRIINEMYEGKRSRNHEQQTACTISQDSFLSLGYESSSSVQRESSYNFLPLRTMDKPETITALPPQHQQDVVYISRNSCHRNCSHPSETFKMQSKPLDSHQVPREVYIQQHLYPKTCNPRAHQCQEKIHPCSRLCSEELLQRKHQKEDKHCMLHSYKDQPHCSTDYSQVQQTNSHRHFHQENLPEASILDGVGKLQILNDEWEDARLTRHGNRACNSTIVFTDSTQPVKYLACEDSSETRRIPIYPREGSCSTVSESSANPKRTHHSTCVKVNKGYVLLPACKQSGKVVYVKPGALHCSEFVHEDCPRNRKILYQEDDSRKHHIRREMKSECDGAYALIDAQHVKQLVSEDCSELCCNQKFTKIAR